MEFSRRECKAVQSGETKEGEIEVVVVAFDLAI